MRSELQRHYRTLELAPGASPEEIKRAYHDLVQVWHPDRFASQPRLQRVAEEKLRALNAAYEALMAVGVEGASAPPSEPQAAPPRAEAPPPPPEPPAAPPPEAAPRQPAREYRAPRWACVARTWARRPAAGWLSFAWVRTAAFALLFVGVFAGAREFYQTLRGPAVATESILQDAARLSGRRPTLPGSTVPLWLPDAPGLGPIDRFARLWATTPRQITEQVAAPAAGLPALESVPARSRPARSGAAGQEEEGYLALPNGTELITPGGKRGFGEVRVINATDHEAAAELVSESAPETALRLVYIRAGAEATIRGIGLGVYFLRFRLGEEWLPGRRDFARYRARGGPVGPLAFFQFQTDGGVQADRYEIMLKPEAVQR